MEAEAVRALYAGVERIMDTLDENGGKAGGCKHGVYLFYDYDGEPIYAGQTKEQLRTRIRRHLTNQRTDAVATRVLDPFEVAVIGDVAVLGLGQRIRQYRNEHAEPGRIYGQSAGIDRLRL